ncbi:hypothetical protein PENSPDRAFT_17215 [Peniophora sp. CONT]|nr:hypothetical protein PENSPDRAFT_17215 [Peniophora sp. CONT]
MPSHDPALLYAIQMAPQGRGYALFNPQPLRRGNELVRDPCVDIGDVGYISDGSFHLLFNVHRQSHDPLQIHGVPRGFRPLERNGSLIEYHLRPCPRVMHSSEEFATELGAGVSVEGVDGPSITWTLERERGATLAYFDRHEVWNAQNKESYKQYFRSNYKSWVDFLRSLGIDRTLRDLILVTGCDRTRAWATMFSESRTVAGRVSLEVRTTVGPSISLTASVRWGTSHTFPSLSGPSADELSSSTRALLANTGDNAATVPHTGGVTADQCMFVRGWQGRSLFRIAELKAAAGPYDPGAYEDPDESEDDKMFVVLDSDEEDSQNRIVEDILQSSQNTSETVLSIALDAIANVSDTVVLILRAGDNSQHRHHDDGILLMHDDELAAQLPGPGEMEVSTAVLLLTN